MPEEMATMSAPESAGADATPSTSDVNTGGDIRISPSDSTVTMTRDEIQKTAPMLRDKWKQDQTAAPKTETPAASVEQAAPPDIQPEGATAPNEPKATAETEGTPNAQPEATPAEAIKVTPDTKVILPDGTEATWSDIEKGRMMQADYTRKTQALAAERKEIDALKTKYAGDIDLVDPALGLWKSLQRDPIGTLKQMEAHYESQGITEPADPQTLKTRDEMAALAQEKARLEQQLAVQQQQQQQQQFDAYMQGLEQKYKDQGFDRSEVLEFCIRNGVQNVEAGFKAMQADRVQETSSSEVQQLRSEIEALKAQYVSAKEEGVKDYLQDKVQKAETFAPPLGTAATGSPPIVENKPRSFDEARKAAAERLSKI